MITDLIAPASLIHSALPAGPGTGPLKPQYGVTFRFTVDIEGPTMHKLGSWSACSGLKVDFKPEMQRSGGAYAMQQWMPGETNYGRIFLKRATSRDHSPKVQQWLQTHAYDWINGEPREGSTATITMSDNSGAVVMKWEVRGVRPASWSAADLDASSGRVAIETLELVHEGFVVSDGKGAKTPKEPGYPEKLVLEADDGSGEVVFPFAPLSITQGRTTRAMYLAMAPTTNVLGDGTEGHSHDRGYNVNAPNVTTYQIAGLVLQGDRVRDDVARLTEWASRPKGSHGKTDAKKASPTLPTLRLTWGDGFQKVPVCLVSLQSTYVRFSPKGLPNRAKVGLTLEHLEFLDKAGKSPGGRQAAPKRPGARNPHSGGIPGRARHTWEAGQSLPVLARDNYDDARAWRAIAAANGIDDPLRIRPGTALYLPARSELGR